MKTTLAALANRVESIELALASRDELIRRAHSEGTSLRAIAEAAKLSHEKVRSLIRADS